MGAPAWVERYVGIPFQDDGFGFSGCHCWGLVRLVLLTEKRIELPTYGEISAGDLLAASREVETQCIAQDWLPVASAPAAFDVVRMQTRVDGQGRALGHVGIMVDPDCILHVEKLTSAVCVSVLHPSVRHRLAGTFRHKELA